MLDMRLGMMVQGADGGSLEGFIREAREAKQVGANTLWVSQIFGFDALTAIAVAGREVPDIEFGTAVVPTYPRHPMMMAQQALTVQALIGDRLCLGIGLSHQIVVEYMWGMQFDRPVRHMREYLAALMPLLESQKVQHEGEVFCVRGNISVPGAAKPSVMVAALGEQMLRLTGAVADGTLTWCVGPKVLRDHTIPTIRQAAADAGRPSPRVGVALPVAVTDDVDAVKAAVGERLAVYDTLPSYKTMMNKEGVGGPADLSIAGTAAEVRDRLVELRDMGVTDFNAVMAARNADEHQRTLAVLREVCVTSG